MNKSIVCQRPYVWRSVIALALFVALIAGCGGVGTGGTGIFVSSLSGKVADGYLANATVFLDKNGNYQLDAGEPSTTTDANGAYTLNVDPADVGKYPIVVLAIKGVTIDKDTNQTLANSYVLSMPKDSVSATVNSNFISPLTSLVRELMETGNYATMQQAMDALSTQMGLPAGTNMMADYITANNTTMHTAAQNMATLMGNQMGQVLGTDGSTITVDVNRYRGMMGTIFSNMSSMMGSNAQTGMSNLNNTMTTALSNMPATSMGQPFKNMSTTFRGMMGGINTTTGSMMGK
jgi:hypothetical protein